MKIAATWPVCASLVLLVLALARCDGKPSPSETGASRHVIEVPDYLILNDAILSNDGQFLATLHGGDDSIHILGLLERATGRQVIVPDADDPGTPVLAAEFSPDGQFLVIARFHADEEEIVEVLRCSNGEVVAGTPPLRGNSHCLSFSPDGKHLAAGGRWEEGAKPRSFGRVLGIDIRENDDDHPVVLGAAVHVLPNEPGDICNVFALSGGAELVTVRNHEDWSTGRCRDSLVVTRWSVPEGIIEGAEHRIAGADYGDSQLVHHDGRGPLLVTYCGDEDEVVVWDVIQGEVLGRFTGPPREDAICVAASDDLRFFAAGYRDGYVRIVDRLNEAIYERMEHPKKLVTSVKFRPQSSRLVSAGWDNKIVLREAAD